MKVMILCSLILVPACLRSDQFSLPVVSKAEVHVDPTRPDDPAPIDMVVSLVGGDEDHTVYLERVYLGEGLDPDVQELDMAFETPTVEMQQRTVARHRLVAGNIPSSMFIASCNSTVPIGVEIGYVDTANLASLSPPGRLAVFCP